MNLISIDENYLDYMRNNGDARIPYMDYGIGHIKPFFVLFDLNDDISYVTQLSSYKPRHSAIHDHLDFHKVWINKNTCKAVVNLNYMFPILKTNYFELNRDDIKRIKERGNYSNHQINNYMNMLDKESEFISQSNICDCAKALYELKKDEPSHIISLRSLDFKNMEAKMIEFELTQIYDKDDFIVQYVQEESSFIIEAPNIENIRFNELGDVKGLMQQVDCAMNASINEYSFEK
ncbi:MAG: type III toxin-antitoxin system ToxN/AbiQ family toxin [Anaerorhabdus sp.]